MSKEYKTKGRDVLLAYLNNQKSRRFCVKDVIEYVEEKDYSMNQATIYRNLDKLCSDGILIKTKQAKDDFCYYQYAGEHSTCHEHLHMQCKKCGKIIHLEGPRMKELCKLLQDEHGFMIVPSESVLIGVCSECR